MERYKILPHTADGKFQAFGRTMEEAFANASLALAFLMYDWSRIQPKISFPVKVRGHDLEQLLVKFLEEVIYLLETRSFLLASVEGLRIRGDPEGASLEASFWGDHVSDKYDLYGDVKAVTYNEMRIEKNDHVTLQVVVDM